MAYKNDKEKLEKRGGRKNTVLWYIYLRHVLQRKLTIIQNVKQILGLLLTNNIFYKLEILSAMLTPPP